MAYSEQHFERMKTEPKLVRQYHWRVFSQWLRDRGPSPFLDACFEWLDEVSDEELLRLANS